MITRVMYETSHKMLPFMTPKTPEALASRIMYAVLVIASIIFVCVYVPLQMEVCRKTTVSVAEYVENATCYCQNNLGGSIYLGTAIFLNTSFQMAFEEISYAGTPIEKGYFYVNKSDNTILIVQSPYIPWYLKTYYQTEWSNNLIHSFEIPLFKSDDGFYSEKASTNCSQYIAVVDKLGKMNITESFISSDAEECYRYMYSHLDPGMDAPRSLTFTYLNNKVYQDNCKLNYCEIQACPWSSIVSLGFFCGTVSAAMFTILKILKNCFLYFYRRSNQKTVPVSV